MRSGRANRTSLPGVSGEPAGISHKAVRRVRGEMTYQLHVLFMSAKDQRMQYVDDAVAQTELR